MKTSRKYTREMYRSLRYLAAWQPGVPLELGDIGIMRGKEFTRVSNIKNPKFELNFEVRSDQNPGSITHSTVGEVSMTSKLDGTVAPKGSQLLDVEAGFHVTFSKKNAILFEANECYNHSISDTIALGDSILQLYREKKWDKDFVVITEIVKASSSTILISSESEGAIDIKAHADIGTKKLDIADASLELSRKWKRGVETEIISETELTPLFKVSKVRSRFLNPPIFKSSELRTPIIDDESFDFYSNELLSFGEIEFDEDDELI